MFLFVLSCQINWFVFFFHLILLFINNFNKSVNNTKRQTKIIKEKQSNKNMKHYDKIIYVLIHITFENKWMNLSDNPILLKSNLCLVLLLYNSKEIKGLFKRDLFSQFCRAFKTSDKFCQVGSSMRPPT